MQIKKTGKYVINFAGMGKKRGEIEKSLVDLQIKSSKKKMKGSVFFSAANIITSTSVKVCALFKTFHAIKLSIAKSVQKGKYEKS